MKKKPSAEDRERSAGKDEPLPISDRFDPIGDSRRARRRALLGAISAAGLTGAAPLPRHWARPVVDHILLPAHAQTSPAGCAISCSVTLEFTTSTGTVSTTTILTSITTSTSVPAVSLTSAGTFACVREPDGDSVSSSSSASESATVTDTTFLTTFSDSSFSSSSSFTGGAECELDLSDVIEEETAA